MKKTVKAPMFFESEAEAENFVLECEADFERRLDAVVADIFEEENMRLLTLSGPTCSGKTTAANKIISEFAEAGRVVQVISIDDFYYDKTILHEKSKSKGEGIIDYDSADTIDLESLSRFVDKIFEGGELLCPRFDFVSGKREEYRKITHGEQDIFLFEGIQAIYPEVREILDRYGYISAYISPQSSLCVGEALFEPNELRLLRRIVRDRHFRKTAPDFTLMLWEGVRANEEKNIFPYEDSCLFKIDSTFAYEISILAPYLRRYLREIDEGSRYRSRSDELFDKISSVADISKKLLPQNSLYREFV